MSQRIAIVGAGIAGLTCAQALSERGYTVSVFEKSKGVSGRVSTRRLPEGDCDHGAQYITAKSEEFKAVIDHWLSQGLIELWEPRIKVVGTPQTNHQPKEDVAIKRYVGSPRMTSPANEIAKNLCVRTSTKVASIRRSPQGWLILDDEHISIECVDVVLFAIPPAQISPLLAGVRPNWLEGLTRTQMLPCWTVMAQTDGKTSPSFDAAFINEGPLSWVANNATKPKRAATPIWTLHASAQWSVANLHRDQDVVTSELVSSFEGLAQTKVISTVTHRWLYARSPKEDDRLYLWDEKLCLGATGDWLSTGNVEGAWLSAIACARAVTKPIA